MSLLRTLTPTVLAVVCAIALTMGLPAPAQACTCIWAGPFAEVAPTTDLVVVGRVESHHDASLRFSVKQVLQGEEERKAITVLGDNGAQCRRYAHEFAVGSEWVMALSVLSPEAAEADLAAFREPLPAAEPRAPFYVISVCGEHWLRVKGEQAKGRITVGQDHEADEKMSLEQLDQLLAEKAEMQKTQKTQDEGTMEAAEGQNEGVS